VTCTKTDVNFKKPPKKNPKNPLLGGFFRRFFGFYLAGFLGGFFIANPVDY
jgi:hypothetical protein